MEGPQSRWLASLAHRVGPDADALHVADAVISTLKEIETVLGPIIGRGGVAALYARGVHLAGLAHPWLTATRDADRAPVDLAALRSVLAAQSGADATAAGVDILETFDGLLSSLVGISLTGQLLGSVCTNSLSEPPLKDPSP
jgi:hypothetical protein